MALYLDDRQFSDQFIPQIKSIVGPLLLEPASFTLDTQEATDLIVFTAKDMRIAARIRRQGYASRYPNEFTIRCQRDSGADTELKKIVNGWGDWLFYGHESGNTINPWQIIDLHKLRAHFIRYPNTLHNPDNISSGRKSNRDGTYFMFFNIPDAVIFKSVR